MSDPGIAATSERALQNNPEGIRVVSEKKKSVQKQDHDLEILA